MNIGIVRLLVLAVSAAAPARAAVEGAAAPDRHGTSLEAEKSAAHVSAVGPGVEVGGPIADLIPLGPPTGARDELTMKPSGPTSAVPEPATLAVFGVGLLLLFRRRSAA